MPEPAPAVREQLVVREQRLEHVHLQLETVRLFGVDGEVNVGLARLQRQFPNNRQHRRDGFTLARNS